MKQDLQIFTNKQRTFTFCDFNWQSVDQKPDQQTTIIPDIYFRKFNDIYIWECGCYTEEKIIESYLLYGEALVEHVSFNDSSFVLYDIRENIIIAVRDFLGNYPLYYYHSQTEKNNFIFTFSMNALLASKLVNPIINYAKIIEYIECDLYARPNNYTFYQQVYRVLPAYLLYINKGKIEQLIRYGKFDLFKYKSFTDEQYIDHFRELFLLSIKKNTDAYKKVAASLSGGLDSSSVCSVAQSLKRESIYTFNFKTNTNESQEDEYVSEVVNKWHNIHRTIQPNLSNYEAIGILIKQNAQPFFVFNYTIQLDLIAAARQANCDVFLSGHWGDQVVGYGTQYIDELVLEKDWINLKRAIEQYLQYQPDNSLIHISASYERKAKAVRLYTIRLLLGKLKKQKQWSTLPDILWILRSQFNCTLTDFLTLISKKIKHKKRVSAPAIDRIVLPEVFLQKDEVLKQYPIEILNINDTFNGPISFAQKYHLDIIFKGNQTYGQEEYFEIYRQNSLRSHQPFFDANLLELSLNTPMRLKFDEGRKRGTLRNALKEYLPGKIYNRVTKAIFTNHYVDLFKSLWEDFKTHTPFDHPIWKIVNKNVFEENIKILLDDQNKYANKQIVLPSLVRIIILANWLDYLESIKKSESL